MEWRIYALPGGIFPQGLSFCVFCGVALMQNLGGILVENTSIRILYFAMAVLMMLGMILTLFLRVQNTEKVFS